MVLTIRLNRARGYQMSTKPASFNRENGIELTAECGF